MSPPDRAAVDYAHLRTQAADSEDVMREVLQMFVDQTGEILSALETASDAKTWKELTHLLKGSARGVGAFAVADAAAAAELAILDRSTLHPLRTAIEQASRYVHDNPL
jgi:HPt (histidine-containing phosphotransfer) domain-containing protein